MINVQQNEENKFYVGFDIHENSFYGTIMDKHGELITEGDVKYSKEGVKNFLGFLPSTKFKIAIEACGLSRGVYNLLTELGYDVVQANPLKTNRIAGKKKTDKVDSKTLADLLRTGYLPLIYVPSDEILKLRDIARHRVKLVRMRAGNKVRIKSYLSRDGKKFPGGWNKETMASLREMDPLIENLVNIIEVIDEQIKPIDRKIRSIAKNNYQMTLIQTIPGIGEISAFLIFEEIGDVKRFDNPKSLVSYAGLCPGVYQSGDTSYDVINYANNKYLKWILMECAGRAATLDSRYMTHFTKVNSRKGWKIARRSLARKMMTDVWHIMSDEEPYRKSES
jgi:transposase